MSAENANPNLGQGSDLTSLEELYADIMGNENVEFLSDDNDVSSPIDARFLQTPFTLGRKSQSPEAPEVSQFGLTQSTAVEGAQPTEATKNDDYVVLKARGFSDDYVVLDSQSNSSSSEKTNNTMNDSAFFTASESLADLSLHHTEPGSQNVLLGNVSNNTVFEDEVRPLVPRTDPGIGAGTALSAVNQTSSDPQMDHKLESDTAANTQKTLTMTQSSTYGESTEFQAQSSQTGTEPRTEPNEEDGKLDSCSSAANTKHTHTQGSTLTDKLRNASAIKPFESEANPAVESTVDAVDVSSDSIVRAAAADSGDSLVAGKSNTAASESAARESPLTQIPQEPRSNNTTMRSTEEEHTLPTAIGDVADAAKRILTSVGILRRDGKSSSESAPSKSSDPITTNDQGSRNSNSAKRNTASAQTLDLSQSHTPSGATHDRPVTDNTNKSETVYLYISMASGGRGFMSKYNRAVLILNSNEIPFVPVEITLDDKALKLWKHWGVAKNKILPAVIRDGEVKMDYNELLAAAESETVYDEIFDY